MRMLLDVSHTGLTAVFLHPLRSAVSILAVVAVVLPFVAGLGIAKGLEAEAEASARAGGDLYVTGAQFGRPVPMPIAIADRIRKIPQVSKAIPRILGDVTLGKDHVHAVLVGIPPEQFPDWTGSIEGSLPLGDPNNQTGPNELVVGTTVARRLNLKVGSRLLPFYRNDQGERVSVVVGVFHADAPLWQSNMILATFSTAEAIFNQKGQATDIVVTCQPGYQEAVARAIEQEVSFRGPGGRIAVKVTSREEMLALLPRGLSHREGVFNLYFLVAVVVAILVLLVTSGLGLSERRREIGILKATGWQTDEILLRGLVESLALALTGACVSLVLAWFWLRICNGIGLASIFLDGADPIPSFQTPVRLTPVPFLLAFLLSFVVVMTGTLYSSWRAATVSPREAMR